MLVNLEAKGNRNSKYQNPIYILFKPLTFVGKCNFILSIRFFEIELTYF